MIEKYSFDEVQDGQKMFRKILRAFANPLQKVNILEYADKLYGKNRELLAVAFTLLDNETTFFSFGNRLLDDNITSLTLSQTAPLEKADFIFAENEQNIKDALRFGKCGTLEDPHKSATVIVSIPEQQPGMRREKLVLEGPGIDGSIADEVFPLVTRAVQLRDAMEFEYPLGMDFLFASPDGDLFAIPRLARRKEN